jgi:hypothetical protein
MTVSDPNTPEQQHLPAAQEPGGHVDETRRRFAKAGLAAPVILTLASRSVWATDTPGAGGACTPSALASATHVSHRPGEDPEECLFGCSPGFWKNAGPGAWDLTGFSTTSNFGIVFNVEMLKAATYPCAQFKANLESLKAVTLIGALTKAAGINGRVQQAAFHATAALLSASHKYVGPFYSAQVMSPGAVVTAFLTALQSFRDSTSCSTAGLDSLVSMLDKYGDGVGELTCPLANDGSYPGYKP